MKKLIFLLVVLSSCILFSQKESYIWYFGYNAGIDFNTSNLEPKVKVDGSLSSWEGCASICDKNGNLLFYTNGLTIWDKTHRIMHNSSTLKGHSSSTQSGLIVRSPLNENRFYIFTTGCVENSNYDGLYYTVVEFNSLNPLGTVTSQNNIINDFNIERITAVLHKNKKNIWIICYNWKENKYYSYLLNENGIDITNVVKSDCAVSNFERSGHYLKASISGKLIASAHQKARTIELYNFNNLTGQLSIRNLIKGFTQWPYGVEFSPNEKVLYASSFEPCQLMQFDISKTSDKDIVSSIKYLDNNISAKFYFGALQLAPNGKIYVAKDNSAFLGVVNSPNELGSDCNYSSSGVYLSPKSSSLGLPNIFVPYLNLNDFCDPIGDELLLNGNLESNEFSFESDYNISSNQKLDKGEIIIQSNDVFFEQFGCKDANLKGNEIIVNNHQSQNKAIITFKTKVEKSKEYILQFDIIGFHAIMTNEIEIYINNQIIDTYTFMNEKCVWDNHIIKWISDSNFAQIKLISNLTDNKETFFALDNFSFKSCDCTPPSITAFPDVNICLGAEAKIGYEPNSEYYYEWITTNNIVNSDKSIATVSPISSQNYVLKVTSKTGCVSYDTVFVNVEPIKKIEIKGKTTICKNSQTTLYVVEDMLEYKWNINENSDSISVNKAGIYNVTCRDVNGCLYFGEVLVNEIDSLDFSFNGDNLLCDGQSGFIEVVEEFDSYIWSDGFEGKRRDINQTGKYWVTVSNKNGCSATKSFTVGSFNFYLEYPDSINLGKICSLSEFSFGAYIKNPNNFSVKVDSIWMHSPNSNLLLHTDSTYNNMIKLNNIFPFTIQYKPTVAEKIQDTIYFKFSEPCNYLIIVPVSGESIENKAEIFVIDTVVFVDSKFCIPISGKMTCNLPYSMLTSYEIEVIFNKKLFLPEFVLNGEILENNIVGDRRIVRIKQDSVFLSTDTTFLTYLCGTIMLSDSIDNIVEIGKIDWKIKDLICETNLGKIRVEHCVLPLRQIKLIENMQIQIKPNPANGNFTIEISNLNDNLFELKLFDITGRTILDFSNSKFEISNNKISINVNADNLAKGTYFINFKSNGKIIQRIIQIY